MDPGSRSWPIPHCCLWNPDNGADTKCRAMEPMCQIMFYNKLQTSDTIHKWKLGPEVGRFNIVELTDTNNVKNMHLHRDSNPGHVEPRHRGGHQVSRHGTDVSNHVL